MPKLDRTIVPLAALFAIATSATAESPMARAPGHEPFTVASSIEWTHLIPVDDEGRSIALRSASGSHFVLHARAGDVRAMALVDRLLMLEASEVEAYLAGADSRPQVSEVLRVTAGIASELVQNLRWLSDNELAFIRADDNGVPQAFMLDVNTRSVRQITRSPTPVAAFFPSPTGVFFFANGALSHPRPVETVGSRTLAEIINVQQPDSTPVSLFFQTPDGRVSRVAVPPSRLAPHLLNVWASPSGRYAVTLIPAAGAPSYWEQYQLPFYNEQSFNAARRGAPSDSSELAYHARYAIVDMQTESVRPLIDAPSGQLSFNQTPARAFWNAEESAVILTNTYTPIQDRAFAQHAETNPAIVEITLHNGRANLISWEPALPDREREAGGRLSRIVQTVEYDQAGGSLTVRVRNRVDRDAPFTETHVYSRNGVRWVDSDSTQNQETVPDPLTISIRQSLNDPPIVVGAADDHIVDIFDPNPQRQRFDFGRSELVEWSEAEFGGVWHGVVVYPPGYDASVRYPLIVQTHGLDSDAFLLDGPGGITTAMAARAFSSAGFVVLQIEDAPQTGDPTEGPRYAAGYWAGIQELIKRQIVDRAKVGLIGFSRTGYYALHLLAEDPNRLRAVTIADSLQAGYTGYIFGTNAPGYLAELQGLTGGEPLGSDRATWFEANPLYHLDRSATAVRIEANDAAGSVLGLWETYSLLRAANRRVDMVYFPHGDHVQRFPAERMGSQGGNVDWFRFWLQQYEDPDPLKADQYHRWRLLRRGSAHQ